jgi:hypothetical protein
MSAASEGWPLCADRKRCPVEQSMSAALIQSIKTEHQLVKHVSMSAALIQSIKTEHQLVKHVSMSAALIQSIR